MKYYETLVVLFYLSHSSVLLKSVMKPKTEPHDERDRLMPIFSDEWLPEDIESRLKDDDVIPEVFDISPMYVVDVSYGPGISVYFGHELELDEVKKEPQHCTWPMAYGFNYTLIMTGVDDPSATNHCNREFLQWLVVDIPGCNVLKGTTIAEYVPLKMPPETGLHRYVFTVYMQPKVRLNWTEPHIKDYGDVHRLKFSNRKFAKKYNLGNVYAANYFTAQPEAPDDGKPKPGISAYETGDLKHEDQIVHDFKKKH